MKNELIAQMQPALFERFKHVLQNGQLGHAYLFSGSFGTKEMALFLSRALFCEDKKDQLPCGDCRNCRLIAEGAFSDVTILSPQGNVIKTETVRDLVKQFAQSGFESSRQVFIVEEAEKMHVNAANSLLKAIEEPQSDVTIFLLTNQEEALLPTIKSRTQVVSFPRNTDYLVGLLEQKGLLKTQATLLAQLGQSPEVLSGLADKNAIISLMGLTKKFVDTLLQSPNRAYLEVARLSAAVSDKAEQGYVFEWLMVLVSQQVGQQIPALLTGLLEARNQWQRNVSFQNALEYWVLQQTR